jgi:hypothetical protein
MRATKASSADKVIFISLLIITVTNTHMTALVSEPGSGIVVCRTGRELAAAFANVSCTVALLSADIKLQDEDWNDVTDRLPVELRRNFTVASFNGYQHVLDLNYVIGKVKTHAPNEQNSMCTLRLRACVCTYTRGCIGVPSFSQLPVRACVMFMHRSYLLAARALSILSHTCCICDTPTPPFPCIITLICCRWLV